MSRGRDWNTQWQPNKPGEPRNPLRFGTKDAPQVAELQGAFRPPPVPPDFQPPPPPGSLQRVLIEEPVDGWWRQAGAFGQRFQGIPPALANTVIPLTEQLQLPGPPAPWWVSFYRYNRDQSTEAEDAGNFDFRARLIYGVGGIQNQIDIDLIQGIQLPIVCSSLTAQLVTYQPTRFSGSVYSPGGREVTAGVMFGKGAGAGALPPTYTTTWEQKDGFTLAIAQQVPDFARSVTVKTTVIDPTMLDACTLSFLDLGGQLLSEISLGYGRGFTAVMAEKGVPIPSGTDRVIFVMPHPTVSNGHRGCLQFFLAL